MPTGSLSLSANYAYMDAENTQTGVDPNAQPCRVYLLARVQAIYDSAAEAEQAILRELLTAAGTGDIITTKLDREIGRAANLVVWC